jgi:hypothetical protein
VHAELEAFAVGSGPAQRKAMATGGASTAPGSHAPTQAKADAEPVDGAPPGNQPHVEQLDGPDGAEALDPGAASTAPIQRAPAGQPPRGKKQFIPFKITVGKPMTREEFEAAANLQMFGTTAIPSQWHNVKDAYTPADSPVEVLFEASLVRRVRGAASTAKGIDTDAAGKITGADARARDFQAQPASDQKAALLAEIDRRYHAASGMAPGSKIRSNESGKAELWRSIRDEVLFQHQHLANLPDRVKALIHVSIQGRDLTPADYDQLFRIAKKIEALPPGAAADYTSKITGSTADLAAFEAAIDSYRGELAGRERADADRTTVQNKLLGLEEVYRLYREYLTTPMEAAPPDMREQLERQLARNGFASIDEFAAYIARFQKAFEDGAVRITLDVLAKYAGKLHKESQRYQDPAVVKDLHTRSAASARSPGLRPERADLERLRGAGQPGRRAESTPRQRAHPCPAADGGASPRRRQGEGSQGQRRGADQGPLEGPSDLRRGRPAGRQAPRQDRAGPGQRERARRCAAVPSRQPRCRRRRGPRAARRQARARLQDEQAHAHLLRGDGHPARVHPRPDRQGQDPRRRDRQARGRHPARDRRDRPHGGVARRGDAGGPGCGRIDRRGGPRHVHGVRRVQAVRSRARGRRRRAGRRSVRGLARPRDRRRRRRHGRVLGDGEQAWLDEAIARGDHFRFISNPSDERSLFVLSRNKKSFVLDNGKKIQSIFGREVEYLKAKGYTFKADGTAIKEP